MSTFALFLAALAIAGSVTDSGPTAIACTGGTRSTTGTNGKVEKVTFSALPEQIYVFDGQANTVRRAMIPRQEFEPVCSAEGGMRFVNIAPGLVRVTSDNGSDPVWTCSFSADRMSGKASQKLRGDWKNGRFHQMEWTMSCSRTAVPVFDLSKRKF